MKRLLLIVVCGLLVVLSTASAQVPDKTKELVQKIEPSLQVIEKQLDEIEADFWKNVLVLDTGSQNFLSSNPLYQSFNRKIADFVSGCGALQRVLYDSGVDVQQQYPIEKRAIGILSVWKRLPQLHDRIKGRRNPVTRKGEIALGTDCIEAIYLTSEVPEDLLNYEALLDDLVIINMELFYITSCSPRNNYNCHTPPEWDAYNSFCGILDLPLKRPEYCKLMSEDLLITSAGEFFMAVRDLRKIILGLRTNPYPEPMEKIYAALNKSVVLQEADKKNFHTAISHIEGDLDQIEREFWDTIYKGGDITVSNKNFTRYGEFQRLLYCLHVDCRNFQATLRKKKIDSGEYNPVTDSIIIYNLGRSHDQELRRQMRRFFNRNNPLEPDSKRERVEFVYNFRAYDANAKELLFDALNSTPASMGLGVAGMGGGASVTSQVTLNPTPYGIRSYLPYLNPVLLNIPERLDEFCTFNTAIFRSDAREFQVLRKSAEDYFNAVKGLRRTIEHWKNKFAPYPSTTYPAEMGDDESELHTQEESNMNALLPSLSELQETLDREGEYYLLTSHSRLSNRPESSKRLITKKLYEPPFTIKAEVMAEFTNIRFLFGGGEIIFNWEVDLNEFRCDIPSARGQHVPGKGYVPIHQWVSFEIKVTHREARIYVDGSRRITLKGKFERTPVGIYTRLGGVLKIKRFQVESGSVE